jgi:hypothetical protein
MKQTAHILVLLLCLSGASCRTPAEPVPVSIPNGFIAVTKSQQHLASGVKALSRGMPPAEVKSVLGNPTSESPQLMSYMLNEDASGGHYVSARLNFDKNGLIKAELGFGHLSLGMKIEP